MAGQRPGLSRTLPKDFVLWTGDSDQPRTPERPMRELTMPPPPHHSCSRFRRPRIDLWSNPFEESRASGSADVALPSIEFPPESAAATQLFHMSLPEMASDERLQVPRERLAPKTPPAQILEMPLKSASSWTSGDAAQFGASIERPSSSCSNISDSSVSSYASYASRPSYGGSCTSPESEIQDPFISYPSSRKEQLETPSKPEKTAESKRQSLRTQKWTSEMDTHLWNTYQLYLQDPTITPFKMVPGSVPPLGVSHRVARQARKTWPKKKTFNSKRALRAQSPSITLSLADHDGKADTNLMSTSRSGSSTPTANIVSPKPAWPKSDASTRRRLKELCKRKFSIAPHYQRLLQSRSPSPFPEPFPVQPSTAAPRHGPSYNGASSFTTRDLGISLVSNSLACNLPLETPSSSTVGNNSDNWFNNLTEPRPSSSLSRPHTSQDTLGASPATFENIPRLGSPFMYHTWGPSSSSRHFPPSTPNRDSTLQGTGSRLRSPPRLSPHPHKHKRRALPQLEDEELPRYSELNATFPAITREGKWKEMGQRRVRARNRGVTLGSLSARERLDQLFTPPSGSGSGAVPNASGIQSSSPQLAGNGHLKPPEDIKRLGSPFQSDPPTQSPLRPNFPRHISSLSDPFNTFSSPSQTLSSSTPFPPVEEPAGTEEIPETLQHTPFS